MHVLPRLAVATAAWLALLVPAALAASGDPDAAFSGAGFTPAFGTAADDPIAVLPQPDGKVVIAGSRGGDLLATRLTATGALDLTFGVGGFATADAGGTEDARGAALLPDGRIAIVGVTDRGATLADPRDSLIVVLTPAGTPDPRFAGGGVAQIDLGNDDVATSVAVRPDGRLVLGGALGAGGYVAQFGSDGSRDRSFGEQGVRIVKPTSFSVIRAIGLDADGRVTAAGGSGGASRGASADGFVLRLTASGDPDFTFAGGGARTLDLGNPDGEEVERLALGGDGTVTALLEPRGLGGATSILTRLTSAGALDPRFGQDAKVTATLDGHPAFASDITPLAGGDVALAGRDQQTNRPGFAVLRADGSLEPRFAASGSRTYDADAFFQAVASDGAHLLAGATPSSLGGPQLLAARVDGLDAPPAPPVPPAGSPPPTDPVPPATGTPTPDRAAPSIRAIRVTTQTRAGRRTIRVRFRLSEPARVRLRVIRPNGRRVAEVTRARPAGRATLSIGVHDDRPRRLRLRLVATDAAGNASTPVTRQLRVR